jgi:hypothetical protein
MADDYTTTGPGSHATSVAKHFASIVLSLTMAVGAEHSEVLQAVIFTNAVDVIYLNHKWLAAPLAQPALRTPIFEQPCSHQTMFNIRSRLTVC